jgi:ABC-type lipoprotein export system ATPase subunit
MNLSFPSKGLNIIVGKSGCGKTTLLNMIGTMDQDYIGSIEIDGVELSTISYNKISSYRNYHSSYIFQINSLFEHLTVKQNIQLILDLQNKEVDVADILEKVGLKGFEDKKVKYLSGGERQRVGIARALVKDCRIVLADEPTSALDSKNAHRILALLKEISKDKLVIVVTHDTKKAFQYADRIIKLVDGRVVDDNVINEVRGEVIRERTLPSRKRLLVPIFWDQFRKSLIINLFIILLCSAALGVFNIAKEQAHVKSEYDSYEKDKTYEFNPLRALTTHVNNELDFYNIVKAVETDEEYTYFKEVINRNGGLNKNDLSKIANLFEGYNIHYGNANYGGLIIQDISNSFKLSIKKDGSPWYWNEDQRTQFEYFIYDEKIDYDIKYGELPTSDDEILITDTVADAYLRRNKLDNSDLRVMLKTELTIKDIYRIGVNMNSQPYYYTEPKPFKIVGIIETNQLPYYTYEENSKLYLLLDSIVQQYRNDPYMNSPTSQPFGYVVTRNHLDAYKTHKYYDDDLVMNDILYNGQSLKYDNVGTFHGFYDYRDIDTYIDNLSIDKNKRLIVKSSGATDILGNQIVVSRDFLNIIYPQFISKPQISDNFEAIIKGTEITLSFDTHQSTVDVKFEIIGVSDTASSNSNYFYVSEQVFDELKGYNTKETIPSITVGLEIANAKDRIKLIEEAYELGYVLVPLKKVPGAYLEHVKTQGDVTLIDDEGFSEKANISIYHLFSKFYNTDDMNSMNSVMEIANSIYAFCLVIGILLSLGFVYLKERRQKMTIMKLSQIGVGSGSIVWMNFITYIAMALSIGVLSYILTSISVNYINDIFVLKLTDSGTVALVSRIRILTTNTSLISSIVAVLITILIGILSSIIIVRKSRR